MRKGFDKCVVESLGHACFDRRFKFWSLCYRMPSNRFDDKEMILRSIYRGGDINQIIRMVFLMNHLSIRIPRNETRLGVFLAGASCQGEYEGTGNQYRRHWRKA